jgi:hypothetical protein
VMMMMDDRNVAVGDMMMYDGSIEEVYKGK